jgi:hypothetical protein
MALQEFYGDQLRGVLLHLPSASFERDGEGDRATVAPLREQGNDEEEAESRVAPLNERGRPAIAVVATRRPNLDAYV